MSLCGSGTDFLDKCNWDRQVLASALDNKQLFYDPDNDDVYTEYVSKQDAKKIALSVYDDLVHHAFTFIYAAKALELIMKEHGLVLGKTFSLSDYQRAVAEVSPKADSIPNEFERHIHVVK